jgi:glycosyltransferase involved in cell wall biosynthesis
LTLNLLTILGSPIALLTFALRMNICFFNTTAFLGGGEKKHLSYALKYIELGHRVLMVAGPDSVLESKCVEHGIEHISIKLGGLSFLNSGKVKTLSAWFEKQQIEVVFFNGSKDIKTGGKAAFKAQVRHRVYWRGIAVSPKASSLNKKIFGQYLTQIITNSQETKDKITDSLPEVESKTNVVYNGVDFKAFDAISTSSGEIPARPTGKLFLGNAARLTAQKAQYILIDLALRLKQENIDFEIWIAGEGEERENLEKLIRENDLKEEVKLLGFISNVKAFMSAIDILVFPSFWEGFGFSMVEANAVGKPVVAFRISSNPEIIEQGVTGILVDEITPKAFVTASMDLILNKKLREQIGQTASPAVRKKFDLDNQAKIMLEQLK